MNQKTMMFLKSDNLILFFENGFLCVVVAALKLALETKIAYL